MIRKAIIPAAGLGTRLLPATKSQPKEMVPVVDKPVIQYVLEEALCSGISDILIVIGRGKRAIEDHFAQNPELERILESKGQFVELEMIRKISSQANIQFVWQNELKGLGHAILQGREYVGKEPFAVLLGDTLIDTPDIPITAQLIRLYEQKNASVVALETVPSSITSRYGIIDGPEIEAGVFRADRFVEKPAPGTSPSNLAIAGRYVFSPEIFNYLALTGPGIGNEIQLTDAMSLLLKDYPILGLRFEGRRYDVGNKLDFIRTNVAYGLKNPELGEKLRKWLKDYLDEGI